jgi:DNA (cytosine-5)-methyltransferase 1
MAGKRKGTDDERYLWGEMFRAIQEIKPKFVIAENVFGITNIDGGLVFEQVCLDLESEGYEVQPFIICAAAKNAPHRRDRCWFIAYSNSNGQFKGRGYDGISQNDDGCYSSSEWSTNSKDFNGCSTNGIAQKQSPTCGGISKQTNVKKNQTSSSSGICGMDEANNTEKIIGNNQFAIDKSRALVSQGLKGIFTSTNRRLEHNQKTFRELATMGLSVDISRINRMEGNATNTNSNGFNQCNSNDEINTSKGGKYAQRNFEQIHNEQPIIKHTNVQRQKRRLYEEQPKTTIREQFSKRNAWSTKSTNWQNFPTQSPLCSGDDGLPTKLDGITFSKWRAESIKGYGNAIVPQVAYEIFKQLESFCNIDIRE